jgi:hypothetical protein
VVPELDSAPRGPVSSQVGESSCGGQTWWGGNGRVHGGSRIRDGRYLGLNRGSWGGVCIRGGLGSWSSGEVRGKGGIDVRRCGEVRVVCEANYDAGFDWRR